jgi:hypothetical protein
VNSGKASFSDGTPVPGSAAVELLVFATPLRAFRPYQPGHAAMQNKPLCEINGFWASRAAVTT